jgi:hypothetical protein
MITTEPDADFYHMRGPGQYAHRIHFASPRLRHDNPSYPIVIVRTAAYQIS